MKDSEIHTPASMVLHPFATLVLGFLSGAILSACGGGGGETLSSPGGWPEISFVAFHTGFNQPIDITHSGDGSSRLFVAEREGRVRIIKQGVVVETPFLDISSRVTTSGGEQGLLGLAFPPGFAQKNHFYVHYTRTPDGGSVVARYLLTADRDVADGGSEEVILTLPQPFSNHNGGQIGFGPDGFLYIALGDGGSGGDPLNNAQDRSSLLGKILRVDVESGDVPYAIPPDNPFLGDQESRDEIWALGLRNPWRFSFDRSTGDLYIGDVGQNLFEEVNVQDGFSTGGENYGWNVMEASSCFGSQECDQGGLTLPVVEYSHTGGDCSVTGGKVYRGPDFPAVQGVYFYGDFCSGRVWGLRKNGTGWESALLAETPFLISTFGEDERGTVYLADYLEGTIYTITGR